MRKNYRQTFNVILSAVSGFLMCASSQALAQVTTDINGTPILLPSTSSSFNQNGFNLPSLPTVAGQDIVRGSSGLSCHSGLGSSGPNFDMGLIGSNDIFDRESVSVYGRVTVPLGKRPKRVDCTKLYDLEIAKLKMELQLLRAGAFPGMLDTVSILSSLAFRLQTPWRMAPRLKRRVYALAKQEQHLHLSWKWPKRFAKSMTRRLSS